MKKVKFTAITALFAITLGMMPVSASLGSVNMTSPEREYLGKGMVLAIIDEGFDVTHESFVITSKEGIITKEESDRLFSKASAPKKDASVTSAYVSEKIPFAYDYGDGDTDVNSMKKSAAGTSLLSIAAGNGKLLENQNPAATGIAPEAQTLAMKVYSDATGTVSCDAVSAAINDALLFGADVILLNLSDSDGYNKIVGERALITDAVNKAHEAGVIVVSPVGENRPYGYYTVFEHEYEMDKPISAVPDVGTVSFPASLDNVFAVGNAESNTVESDFFTMPDGTAVPYGDSNYMYKTATDGKTFADFFAGKTLAYESVERYGRVEDFAKAPDLSGKLAVVERGEISFTEKAKNAAAKGAVGLIVTDSQSGKGETLTIKLELTDAPIPVILVPSDVRMMLRRAETKIITVHAGETYTTKLHQTPTPYLTSAKGTTPYLTLKPDIMATGINIPCAAADNTYTNISGCNAAAARIAGMCLIVKEKFESNFITLNRKISASHVKALLSNSAALMKQKTADSLYSPRVMGAGAAALDDALKLSFTLTSNGAPKIRLGEHTSTVEMPITVQNLSREKKTYTLDAIAGSDGYVSYTYGELDIENPDAPFYERLGKSAEDTLTFITDFKEFKDAHIGVDKLPNELNPKKAEYSPLSFSLAPMESRTFTLTLEVDNETCLDYKLHFENGFFVEGFVRVSSGDELASIPFVGFYGNFFTAAPYLDSSVYDSAAAIYSGIYLYREMDDEDITKDDRIVLGADEFSDISKYGNYDSDALYISPYVDHKNSALRLNLSLLRSIEDVNITVTDSRGDIIDSHSYGNITRTYISNKTGMSTSKELLAWSLRDRNNASYVYPDGIYTITLSYKKPTIDNVYRLIFPVIIDSIPPVFEGYELDLSNKGKPILKVNAYDDNVVRKISVASAAPLGDGSFDISGCYTKHIYIDIFDGAANSTTVRIENPLYTP